MKYSEFKPTTFDHHINIPDREDWLPAPVSQTSDSPPSDRANFADALEALGSESDDVEVHRFGHWGPGWFEIIIVRPDTKAATELARMCYALANYPVLDDERYSKLCQDEYDENWKSYACKDFVAQIERKFRDDLTEEEEDLLDDRDPSLVREFFESLITSGEYWVEEGSGINIRVRDAVENCTLDDVLEFLKGIGA